MNEAMTPDEFKSIGELFWGPKWKQNMSKALHKDRGTIYRYCSGFFPISILMTRTLRAWVERFQQTGQIPK